MSNRQTPNHPTLRGGRGGRGRGASAPETPSTKPFVITKKEKVPARLTIDRQSDVKIGDLRGVKDAVIVVITDGERTYQVNFHRPIGKVRGLAPNAFLSCLPADTQDLSARLVDDRQERRNVTIRDEAFSAVVAKHASCSVVTLESGKKTIHIKKNGEVFDLLEREEGKFRFQEKFSTHLETYRLAMKSAADRNFYEPMLGPNRDIPQRERVVGYANGTVLLMDTIRAALLELDLGGEEEVPARLTRGTDTDDPGSESDGEKAAASPKVDVASPTPKIAPGGALCGGGSS